MAAAKATALLAALLIALDFAAIAASQVEESGMTITAEALQWPMAMSMYGDLEEFDGEIERRSLFWRKGSHYYISYGALAANRVPCPPRSGRSYYTHNCFSSRAPANPYSRGCSRITRCRR